jgi:hypothetical protein
MEVRIALLQWAAIIFGDLMDARLNTEPFDFCRPVVK